MTKLKKLLAAAAFGALTLLGLVQPLKSQPAPFPTINPACNPTTGVNCTVWDTTTWILFFNSVLYTTGSDGSLLNVTANGMTSTLKAWIENLSGGVDGCKSILLYGGNNVGTGDNTPALSAAETAGGDAVCVYFPSGTYTFASQQTFTLPSVTASYTLKGDGAENTKLLWLGGQGIALSLIGPYNTVHIRDMSLLSGMAAGGTAINITQTAASIPNPAETALSDISGVTIRGSDGLAMTDYWNSGIYIFGASNINFLNDFVNGPAGKLGIGLTFTGTSSLIPVVFNVSGSTFNYLATGIEYGTYTQGVTISQSNFTYDMVGIATPVGGVNLAQLSVTNSEFNCLTTGIFLEVTPEATMLANNFFILPTNSLGINLTLAGAYTVVGNVLAGLSATNTAGLQVTSSQANGVITGNMFVQITNNCIALLGPSSGVNVQSNSYQACGTNVVDGGSGNTVGGGSP